MKGYKIINPYKLLHKPIYIEQCNFNPLKEICFYQWSFIPKFNGDYTVAVWKIKYKP